MTLPDVAPTSIVMVSYHTGPVLFRAVDAVLAQTRAVELCVVDNGNPPDTLKKLQDLAARDDRVKLITGHGNVGFSRACNLGAKAARGNFVLFLNPDSLLPPDSIEKLLLHAAELARPFMIGARLVHEDGRDQRGCRRALLTPKTMLIEGLHLNRLFPQARLNFDDDPVPMHLVTMPAISGAFMFLPREDFWHIGGFDGGYFLHVEDLDLCLRFRRAGGEIYFAPDVRVMHIGATSDATKAFIEKHKARGFVRYLHKNFGGQYPLPLLWLLDALVWGRTWLKIALSSLHKRINRL